MGGSGLNISWTWYFYPLPLPFISFYCLRNGEPCLSLSIFWYQMWKRVLIFWPPYPDERRSAGGGGSIYHSSNIPIPFCLLNFKKRELFLGYSFWNPFVRLNVFTPKHNFVRIQKYILGRYILTSLSIFQFSWFYILHNLYQNFPEKIQIYCDLLLLLLLWLSVFHRCAIFTPPPPSFISLNT